MNEQTGEKTSKKETKHIGALVSVHRYRFTPGAFSLKKKVKLLLLNLTND